MEDDYDLNRYRYLRAKKFGDIENRNDYFTSTTLKYEGLSSSAQNFYQPKTPEDGLFPVGAETDLNLAFRLTAKEGKGKNPFINPSLHNGKSENSSSLTLSDGVGRMGGSIGPTSKTSTISNTTYSRLSSDYSESEGIVKCNARSDMGISGMNADMGNQAPFIKSREKFHPNSDDQSNTPSSMDFSTDNYQGTRTVGTRANPSEVTGFTRKIEYSAPETASDASPISSDYTDTRYDRWGRSGQGQDAAHGEDTQRATCGKCSCLIASDKHKQRTETERSSQKSLKRGDTKYMKKMKRPDVPKVKSGTSTDAGALSKFVGLGQPTTPGEVDTPSASDLSSDYSEAHDKAHAKRSFGRFETPQQSLADGE